MKPQDAVKYLAWNIDRFVYPCHQAFQFAPLTVHQTVRYHWFLLVFVIPLCCVYDTCVGFTTNSYILRFGHDTEGLFTISQEPLKYPMS